MHHYFLLASKALLQRLLYCLIVINSCTQYSCLWRTFLQTKTQLSYIFHIQTWARVKAEARQQKGKREAKQKKHYCPKRPVNFLLCDFTRDKIGKRGVEWRNTQRKRTAEDSSYIPLPQHHLLAQPTVPPGSPGCTPLAVHGEKQEHHESSLFQMSAYKRLPFCNDKV